VPFLYPAVEAGDAVLFGVAAGPLVGVQSISHPTVHSRVDFDLNTDEVCGVGGGDSVAGAGTVDAGSWGEGGVQPGAAVSKCCCGARVVFRSDVDEQSGGVG